MWCTELLVFVVYCFHSVLFVTFLHWRLIPLRPLLSYCISAKISLFDDSMCVYPTSIIALTQIYITPNLTYIRHVLRPEVLTEMQNVIMSLIVAVASRMINCVVDSLHYARGRERQKRLQIPSHIYYPIKLPSSFPLL